MRNFILLLAFCFTATATDYFVTTTGSDAADGTSLGAAWLTVQKAANTMVAGDTVFVGAGLFDERVNEGTSGTLASPIRYVGAGTNLTTIRQFTCSGNFVQLMNFEITHATALGSPSPGVRITGSYCSVLNNYVHDTTEDNIDYSSGNGTIVEGNTLGYPGYVGNHTYNGVEFIALQCNNGSGTRTNLVWYNRVFNVADFANMRGGNIIYANNELGPTDPNGYGGSNPHVDGCQFNTAATNVFILNNFHWGNTSTESHLCIASIDGVSFITLAKNVSTKSGDNDNIYPGPGDDWWLYHNTITDVGTNRSGHAAVVLNRGGIPGDRVVAGNSVYFNAPDTALGSVYKADSGTITHTYDLAYPFFPASGATDLNVDPVFVDASAGANDYRIQTSSPAKDSATNITDTTDSGTGTTITVANSRPFTDGMGITTGLMKIYVGNDNDLTITAVNYAANTITVDQSITWSSGDDVGYAYRGAGPDRGAYEFGDTFLTAATYTAAGLVTTTGDTAFVRQFRNGIPIAQDFTSPYSFSHTAGDTYKAYAAHAQLNPVVTATALVSATGVIATGKPIFSGRPILR